VYYQRVQLSFFLAARSYFEIENKVCNVKTYNYYIARIAVGGLDEILILLDTVTERHQLSY